MNNEVATKSDLKQLRRELNQDFTSMLQSILSQDKSDLSKGLKTKEVRSLFGCSTNKLVSLRIARKIRTKKIGGTLYYHPDDIKRVLEEGF